MHKFINDLQEIQENELNSIMNFLEIKQEKNKIEVGSAFHLKL